MSSLRYLQLIFTVTTRAICRPNIGLSSVRRKKKKKFRTLFVEPYSWVPNMDNGIVASQEQDKLLSVKDDSSFC